jgi:hypothetical protein
LSRTNGKGQQIAHRTDDPWPHSCKYATRGAARGDTIRSNSWGRLAPKVCLQARSLHRRRGRGLRGSVQKRSGHRTGMRPTIPVVTVSGQPQQRPAISMRAADLSLICQVSRKNVLSKKSPGRCRGLGSLEIGRSIPLRHRGSAQTTAAPATAAPAFGAPAEAVVHAHGDHIHVLADPIERTGKDGVHDRERIV